MPRLFGEVAGRKPSSAPTARMASRRFVMSVCTSCWPIYVIGPVQTSADRAADSPILDGRAAYMAACSSYTAGKARASRVGVRAPYGFFVGAKTPRRAGGDFAELVFLF